MYFIVVIFAKNCCLFASTVFHCILRYSSSGQNIIIIIKSKYLFGRRKSTVNIIFLLNF